MDPNFRDPPLGRSVVSQKMADKVMAVDGKTPNPKPPWSTFDQRSNHPHSLATKLPEIPYWSDQNYLRRMEEYYRARDQAWASLSPTTTRC